MLGVIHPAIVPLGESNNVGREDHNEPLADIPLKRSRDLRNVGFRERLVLEPYVPFLARSGLMVIDGEAIRQRTGL